MGIQVMTTDQFKETVLKKQGDKVEILSEYNGGTKSINFIYHCELHGETHKSINAKNILAKYFQPCDECRRDLKSEKRVLKSHDHHYQRLKNYVESKGGILITPSWTKSKNSYEIQCGNKEHPTFFNSADKLLNSNQWCPYCSGRSGDFQKQISDIIESKNGTLLSDYKNSTEHVKVKCNAHNYTWDIMPLNIKKGRWCPICNLPYSEKVVYDYLVNNGVHIEAQYKFDDLIGNNEFLKFDFGILDDKDCLLGLIEVDGEEHRRVVTIPKEINAQQRDKEKDTYCKTNNVPLYRLEFNGNRKFFRNYNLYYDYIGKQLANFLNKIQLNYNYKEE